MEQEENPDGSGGWTNTLTRIFVSTPSGVIGIEERTPSQTTRKYLHRDHLGSVVAVSGEAQTGNAPILAEYSFDAWGALRNPSDWTATTNNLTTTASGDRGFTGHEMLDGIDLVHMNGRIYNQELGRFLSADPLIQAPENLQSFNRYSYVFNNPLTHTDPSGFKTKSKAAASEAATSSTQLAEAVSSTEISSQDNIGGSTSESSEQVDDYYSDGSNTQVDQSSRATQNTTNPDDENIDSTANSGDKNGYGIGTGNKSAKDQAEKGAGDKFTQKGQANGGKQKGGGFWNKVKGGTKWVYNKATGWHFEGRVARNKNDDAPLSVDKAEDLGGTVLPSGMNGKHDNKDGNPEKKVIFKDGREYVYDGATDKLLTGPEKGTFNYINPAMPTWNPLKWPAAVGRGVGHFGVDMLPDFIGGSKRGPE